MVPKLSASVLLFSMLLTPAYMASTSSGPAAFPHQHNSASSTGNPIRTEALRNPLVSPEVQGVRINQAASPPRAGGHYQVSEPNFTVTLPCENCSRVVKLYPTDWGDYCSAAQPTTLRTTDGRTAPINSSQEQDGTNALSRGLTSSDSTTLALGQAVVYSTTRPPIITLNGHVFTANEAGFYPLGRDSTLVPGGQPVTIDGTVVRMDCGRTRIVIGETTSELQPITIAVTTTVGLEPGSNVWNGDESYTAHSVSGGSMPQLPLSMASPTDQATSAGSVLRPTRRRVGDWRGALVLVLVGMGMQGNLPV